LISYFPVRFDHVVFRYRCAVKKAYTELAFLGRSLVAPNTESPQWRTAQGGSSHQDTTGLILAYLANIRLTSGQFEPVFCP
jgi:hypothetical protein